MNYTDVSCVGNGVMLYGERNVVYKKFLLLLVMFLIGSKNTNT